MATCWRREIEDNVLVYQVEAPQHTKHEWSFFRDAAKNVLWPHLDAEYQQELTGIAEGLKAHGSTLDLWDVVALNGYLELSDYYLPWLDAKQGTTAADEPMAPGKCSAFIATGSATKGGKIVIAHSNWSSYAEGERWTVVFDIVPASGQHILMDGMPGVITSEDDFGVNASGLMITETTLPMAKGFDVNGIPEFDRSRKAMQYATSIDEYAAIMRKGNNGGYANSWLIGDRKTGEIAYLELGLNNTPLTKKKDGYFVSSNFAADPALIRDDTPGFDPGDPESTMNARHHSRRAVHAGALRQAGYGAGRGVSLRPLRHSTSTRSMPASAACAGTRRRRRWAKRCGAIRPTIRRRGDGQGDGLGAGGEDELHRPGGPSLRRGFSCCAVSGRASGVRMAEADSARHDRRTVDGVHGQ